MLIQLLEGVIEFLGHFGQQITALSSGLTRGDEQLVESRTKQFLQLAFDFKQSGSHAFHLTHKSRR